MPWVTGFFGERFLPYGVWMLAVKIILSCLTLAFIAFLRDVRKKIHELDMMKQSLGQAIVHDLKGPLTGIIGALSIISEPGMELAQKEKLLDIASKSSRFMLKLVQTLLDTDRLEIAKMTVQRQKIDVNGLISRSMQNFSALSRDMGIKLNFAAPAAMPALCADGDLLERVIENLMFNSFKYTPRGGEISAGAKYRNGFFYFEVADTGSGIPTEHIQKVFEKYYRVESEESDSCRGSGLGLYFCRLAVEAQGGKIDIDSGRGKGTRVFFRIPEIPREIY